MRCPTVLDWAIKLRLFQDRAGRRGIPMERFGFLNSIVKRLNTALAGAGANGRHFRLSAVLGADSPIPEEAERMGAVLAREGLTWSDFENFLSLRDEFYQIDTRFGQFGPRGIFTELDRRGALDHRVAAVEGVEEAMRKPPVVGRAKLRGEWVRRLAGQSGARCNWMSVIGPDGSFLDLSDPFASAEAWSDPAAPPKTGGDLPPDSIDGDLFGDPNRFQQMLDAIRRRHGRARSRA